MIQSFDEPLVVVALDEGADDRAGVLQALEAMQPDTLFLSVVNGERRSFALLRPVGDTFSHDRVRDLVLEAYAAHEVAQDVQQ